MFGPSDSMVEMADAAQKAFQASVHQEPLNFAYAAQYLEWGLQACDGQVTLPSAFDKHSICALIPQLELLRRKKLLIESTKDRLALQGTQKKALDSCACALMSSWDLENGKQTSSHSYVKLPLRISTLFVFIAISACAIWRYRRTKLRLCMFPVTPWGC